MFVARSSLRSDHAGVSKWSEVVDRDQDEEHWSMQQQKSQKQ